MFGDRRGRRKDEGNVGKGGDGCERRLLGLLGEGGDGGIDRLMMGVAFFGGGVLEVLFGWGEVELEGAGIGEWRGDEDGDGGGGGRIFVGFVA